MSLGPLMISLRGLALEADEREWLQSPAVAGAILFSRNFADLDQLQRLVDEIHSQRSPPLLVAVDQEGGRVQRFHEPFQKLPAMRVLGHCYDEDPVRAIKAAHACGWVMAAELRSIGIDLSFAPVVDLDLGLADVIGDRAFHQDAQAVSELAAAFVGGARTAGMAATAKHFPTHAGARADSHVEFAEDKRDYDELVDDLAPYRHLIDKGLHSIMMAHVAFPRLDPKPASMSQWWIGTELRRELGFTGAVISDDMSMAGAGTDVSCPDRIRAALDAGCDMVLLCNAPEAVPEALDSLADYSNPPARLRLMRLRGEHAQSWEDLHSSFEWTSAVEMLNKLDAAPELELEG